VSEAAPTTQLSDVLRDRRILVCLGPGGVGKTTSSAALAVAGALSGRRTLVLTIDPAKRLANALGLDALSAEERPIEASWWAEAGLSPRGSLHALMLDTKRACDHLILKHAPSPEMRDRIMANPLYEQVSTALAGSHDYMAMEKLYELRQEGDYDLLVLDTPPSAHALDFLEAPRRLSEGMDATGVETLLRPMSSLGKGGLGILNVAMRVVVSGLSRFTGTNLLRDLADFFIDFSEMFGGFRARASAVLELLASEETSFLVVTAPASLTVAEALHLRRELRERSLPFGGYIVNRHHPSSGAMPSRDTWPLAEDLAGELATAGVRSDPGILSALLASLYQTLEEEQLRVIRDSTVTARLRAAASRGVPVPFVVTVPEFDEDVHDLRGLHAVASAMGLT
jgi:anion-transporting  ArsA/GET3 family ATPase